jgi:hypothetical protein
VVLEERELPEALSEGGSAEMEKRACVMLVCFYLNIGILF